VICSVFDKARHLRQQRETEDIWAFALSFERDFQMPRAKHVQWLKTDMQKQNPPPVKSGGFCFLEKKKLGGGVPPLA